MSKNKKTVVIRNRIDYDTLAEAIVKAQSNINKESIKDAIIEANNEIEDSKPKFKYSRELLKFVIEPTLWLFALFGGLFSIGIVVYSIKNWQIFNFKDLSGYLTIFSFFGLFAFSLLFAIFSGLSAKEIEKTENTEFVFSMFSNIMAFVALIVAAIALIK